MAELIPLIAKNLEAYGVKQYDPLFNAKRILNVNASRFEVILHPVPTTKMQKGIVEMTKKDLESVMKIMMETAYTTVLRSKPNDFHNETFQFDHWRPVMYNEKLQAKVRYEGMAKGTATLSVSLWAITKTRNTTSTRAISITTSTRAISDGKGYLSVSPLSPRAPEPIHCSRKRALEDAVKLDDGNGSIATENSKRGRQFPAFIAPKLEIGEI